MSNEKTHWLQSPNKNYLGHWDLPENKDLILTIKSAQWEEVKNPITNSKESKRVVRFEDKGVKPFICNQTNAQSIVIATGVKFMEDSAGYKIALFVDNIKDKRTKEDIDCIRIRRRNNVLILGEIKELFELKKSSISEDMIKRIEDIIKNEEVASYQKLINHLKSL
jgi:hypothetical protein